MRSLTRTALSAAHWFANMAVCVCVVCVCVCLLRARRLLSEESEKVVEQS
jgi:hypothetical protein